MIDSVVDRKLQAGCYIFNQNTKIVHSLNFHTIPWSHIEYACVQTDARHIRFFPKARPCKFCMSLFHIRVMGMEDYK